MSDSDSDHFQPASFASGVATSFSEGFLSYKRSQTFFVDSHVSKFIESNDGHPEDLEEIPRDWEHSAFDQPIIGGELSNNMNNLGANWPSTPPVISRGSCEDFSVPRMEYRHGLLEERNSLLAGSHKSYGAAPGYSSGSPQLSRRASEGKLTSVERGQSTFGQTLFNTTSVLVGIGMLSEPLAFSYTGWIGGLGLLLLYACMACYTANLLARMMYQDPRIKTYADVAEKAFGSKSVPLTNFLFCLELFTLSVVLVTLFADSLYALVPIYSLKTYKLLSLLLMTPTVLLPLSLLAYASLIGIFASILILFVIIFDGVSKTSCPGSLLHPCKTIPISVISLWKTGRAFGLFMAGFSGHAVIPSIARDMKEPREFKRMSLSAFAIASGIYALVGGAGYLMFGVSVSEEVSQDLLLVEDYNATLNKLLMWMLVVMPLTKFALGIRPLNTSIEIFLALDNDSHRWSKNHARMMRFVTRILLVALSVTVSIMIPDFSSMMSFLGSFSAFTICIIVPIAAKVAMDGITWLDSFCLTVALVMAGWGTAVSFA